MGQENPPRDDSDRYDFVDPEALDGLGRQDDTPPPNSWADEATLARFEVDEQMGIEQTSSSVVLKKMKPLMEKFRAASPDEKIQMAAQSLVDLQDAEIKDDDAMVELIQLSRNAMFAELSEEAREQAQREAKRRTLPPPGIDHGGVLDKELDLSELHELDDPYQGEE
ncbi:hypothetical protein KW794_02080 [Candidatus Saccharibacteria bacterium]|nr:hypothetical protein [Candidatus Saccharibacteria bacterium]